MRMSKTSAQLAPSGMWRRYTITSVSYLGTALMPNQSPWTESGSKQPVTTSGSPPSSFMICQSQLAGMKQTGWLHALHQLIGLTGGVTFQSTYACRCQQSVITYTTVCWVLHREKFFLGIRNSTSSNALQSFDSDRDLLERGQYALDIKPGFSLQEAARWAVYSKPVKQRSELQLASFPPSCGGAGISPTGLSSGALTPTLIACAASNLD